MRHALSQALRRVHIGPKKLKLDEETRWQIAGEAVGELRRFTPRDRVAGRGLSDAAKVLLFAANTRGCGTELLRHATLKNLLRQLVPSPRLHPMEL